MFCPADDETSNYELKLPINNGRPPGPRSLCIYLFGRLVLSTSALSFFAVLPNYDPIITGLSNTYEDGEFLNINCTSDVSYPAPELVWYINDKEVSCGTALAGHE